MSTELILIRHGEAVRVNGDYLHAPLTSLGRQQATQTGQHLRLVYAPLGGFYTSPLRRAKETAGIIGRQINETPGVQPGLREVEALEVPVLALFEVLSVLRPIQRYLAAHAGKLLRWPAQGRVAKALTGIVGTHPGTCVVVVAHVGVISSVLAWFFPGRRLHWWRTRVGNCSLTRLRVNGARAELLALNETHHLNSVPVTMQPPARTVNLVTRALPEKEQ